MSKLDKAYALVGNYYRNVEQRLVECRNELFPLLEKAVGSITSIKTARSGYWVIPGDESSFRVVIQLVLSNDYYYQFDLFFDGEGVDTGIMVYLYDYAGTVRNQKLFVPGVEWDAFARVLGWVSRNSA